MPHVRYVLSVLSVLLLSLSCRTPDETAPSVHFLSPTAGDTLYAGQVVLLAEAHDNIEVTNVEFFRAGTYLDSTGLSLSDTFKVLWDAAAETLDTGYWLRAIAHDRAGNSAAESIPVIFTRLIPPGALAVTSVPPGAAIWIDGTNTGMVTPDTVTNLAAGPHQLKLTLARYADLDTSLEITGGQTLQFSAALWGYAVVSGTVVWPGHSLSAHCVALLDTSHDAHGAYILYGPVDPATGAFTLAARVTSLDSAYCIGFDDVDGNQYPSTGDGQGFWDRSGDQQMTPADMVPLAPGDTIRDALIYMVTVP